MSLRQKFEVTVVDGAGETTVDFCGENRASGLQGHRSMRVRAFGLISPDDTPMYDFAAYDEDGHIVAYGDDVSVQHATVECNAQLDGSVRIVISDAADDGVYEVKPLR